MTPKQKLIQEYLEKYNGLPIHQIARRIWEDFPHLFNSVEHIRSNIRNNIGKNGKVSRQKRQAKINMENGIGQNNKDIIAKWGLVKSKSAKKETFKIPINFDKILWISDIHFPNHDEVALTTALEYGFNHGANCIIIGGDLLDNSPFTRFLWTCILIAALVYSAFS